MMMKFIFRLSDQRDDGSSGFSQNGCGGVFWGSIAEYPIYLIVMFLVVTINE